MTVSNSGDNNTPQPNTLNQRDKVSPISDTWTRGQKYLPNWAFYLWDSNLGNPKAASESGTTRMWPYFSISNTGTKRSPEGDNNVSKTQHLKSGGRKCSSYLTLEPGKRNIPQLGIYMGDSDVPQSQHLNWGHWCPPKLAPWSGVRHISQARHSQEAINVSHYETHELGGQKCPQTYCLNQGSEMCP